MVLGGLALLTTVACLGLGRWLLPLGSGNSDEAVYQVQSQVLQRGDLTLSATEHDEPFQLWLTGVHDGRRYTQYLPGWPAAMAVTDLVAGSSRLAAALSVGALVPAVYGFALRLLQRRRTAMLAAILSAITPLFLLHGALRLSYVFTTLLLLLFGWALLRADDLDRPGTAAVAGIAWGAALFTRPFDAVLFGAVLGALVAWRRRRDVAGLLRLLIGSAATVVPIVVVLMVHNRYVTGGWLDFPLSATSPDNRFGFGTRQILPGEDLVDYSFAVAREAFRLNVRGLLSWLPGGIILVGLALGALRNPDRRAERCTLTALAVAFPLGYLFWWATAWSAPGATNGLGPHYYLPAVPAILILGADGLAALAQRRRGAASVVVVVVLGLGFSLWALPEKIDRHRRTTELIEERLAVLPDDLADAVVLADWPSDYVGKPNPFMINDPALENPVLYAVDGGADVIDLAHRFPSRTLVRHRKEQGPQDDFLQPSVRLTPVEITEGASLDLEVTVTNPADFTLVAADLSVGSTRVELPAEGSTEGREHTFSFPLAPEDVGEAELLVIGVELTVENDPGGGDRYEQRIDVAGGETLAVATPGRGWWRVHLPSGPSWLAADVRHVLDVSVADGG